MRSSSGTTGDAGFDQIRADRLDLIQDILLSRQADGDHEDKRSCTNHHAQRGKCEADLVAAESVVSKADDLAQYELGRLFRGCRGGSGHAG